MNVDIRTDHEIAREKTDRAIIDGYLTLQHQYPDAAPTRIMGKVAAMHGMTSMGVRRILERNHIILSNNNKS